MIGIPFGLAPLSRKVENTALATLSIDISTIDNWCQCVSDQISATGKHYGRGKKNSIRNSCANSELLVALSDADICNDGI